MSVVLSPPARGTSLQQPQDTNAVAKLELAGPQPSPGASTCSPTVSGTVCLGGTPSLIKQRGSSPVPGSLFEKLG